MLGSQLHFLHCIPNLAFLPVCSDQLCTVLWHRSPASFSEAPQLPFQKHKWRVKQQAATPGLQGCLCSPPTRSKQQWPRCGPFGFLANASHILCTIPSQASNPAHTSAFRPPIAGWPLHPSPHHLLQRPRAPTTAQRSGSPNSLDGGRQQVDEP